MIRIAVCDDMVDILTQTRAVLLQWPNKSQLSHLETFFDGDSLLRAHAESPFDIVFLDVVMPGLNGIETARQLRTSDSTVKIVFLTSSAEFAVESYTVKADNYLLKPLDPTALYRCLDQLQEELRDNARSITIRSTHAVHRILFRNIEYVESQNKQLLLYLSNGSSIRTTTPLYSLEPQLLPSDGFFKCHRSYIVNFHWIETYSQKEIVMRSGCRIPISRGCNKEFETAYFAFLFGKAGDM